MGFTKLDEGILRSSIMAEPSETFKVWIAILASCDYDGIARVSSTFLASACYLSLDAVDAAIAILEAPDKRSRSLTEDGRRVHRVDGGYFVINYAKYRAFTYSSSPEAIRQRKHREKERDTSLHVTKSCDISASASASASAFNKWWAAYPRKIARKVAAKAYAAAIKAGASPEDLLRAVDGYRAKLKRDGTEERFCLHASTFLHDERWRDYLDIKVPLDVGASPSDKDAAIRRASERNRKNFDCLKEGE